MNMPPENKDIFVISNVGLNAELDKIEHGVKKTSFEDALKLIGFGKVQIMVLLVCGLILMAVINETMGMAIIVPAAQCDLELSSSRKGVISAVSFIGILISSPVWGYLADIKGRRKVIIYTLLVSIICTIVSSFSTNFWTFAVTRFLCGIFIAGSSSTIYAYLGEFNTLKNRAAVIAWASIFVALANIYIPVCGWIVLPQSWSIQIGDEFFYRPWRLLLIINSLPGFIGAVWLYYLPESGKYLLSQGHETAALHILKWMYDTNNGRSDKEFSVQHLQPEFDKVHYERVHSTDGKFSLIVSFWKQTAPLLKKPLRFHFIICCFLMFGVFFVSAGMGLWFPHIQNQISFKNETVDQTVCEIMDDSFRFTKYDLAANIGCDDTVNTKAFVDSITLGAFYVVGYVVYALFIKSLGRGVILVSGLLGSGIAGLALQWITQPLSIVIFFCTHIMLSGICVSVTNGAVVDLIPTHLRGMAVCIVLMFGRLGSVVGSNLLGAILELNCSAAFYLDSIFIIGCALVALLLPCK